jgi:PhnB protein
MSTLTIPEGYQQVMPYLIVKGAADFAQFMQDVFGAEEKMRHMRDEHIIAHGEILVVESVIMFADATDAFGPRTGGFMIYVKDADVTYINALAAGATSVMPVADMPYGRSGGVTDQWGNTWWMTTHVMQ